MTGKTSHCCRMVNGESDPSLYDREHMEFVAYIDGSCKDNGKLHAQGGFGVAILNKGNLVATAGWLMCHCSGIPHTSNRAELKAAYFVLRLIHEFAVIGKPKHRHVGQPAGSDGRPLEDGVASLIVKSDSRYVKDGFDGAIRTIANEDLWETLRLYKECTEQAVDLKFKHIRGHTGNRWNELADKYARLATGVKDSEKWCLVTCKVCDDNFIDGQDLAVHFKEIHFRHKPLSDLLQKLAEMSAGIHECELCTRKLRSQKALKQHMRSKHHMDLDDDGRTALYTP